ncbi:SGNH/GDSL hydrolase family protein [Microlunatus flavus]|uniref:Lysophospholipase L1 n=1 Tax=Microlunatus flavus TaxID=1036181 RepID=A0A1H9DQ64_9ACTN|nr:SGNH/GDSL hydrolase family protein [Microlunatus flavus]SEQ15622.1 Lysophospholipase L1 [Microlunatus flavus]
MLRPARALRLVAPVLAVLLAGACGTAVALAPTPDPGRAGTAAPSSSSTPSPSGSTPTPRSGATLQVVGLGDSVTSGYHCDCDDYVTGFAHLLAARDGIAVKATNDGEAGSTSNGLADELDGTDGDDRAEQHDVAKADVVVLTMGANDLEPALDAFRQGSCDASCSDPEVAQMQTDLGRVLDRVQTLEGGHARVLVTTYWNVFTDGDVARKAERSGYLAWSDTLTRQANQAIATVARQHGATLVDLYAPFKGDGSKDPTDLLADDGDHPDPAGTAVISKAVLAAYEARP